MSKKILVTGGCGYIGSHTIVDLVQHGYTVISADDFSRSNQEMLEGIHKIIGTPVKIMQSIFAMLHRQKLFSSKIPI